MDDQSWNLLLPRGTLALHLLCSSVPLMEKLRLQTVHQLREYKLKLKDCAYVRLVDHHTMSTRRHQNEKSY